jgi:two-component system alkaline phosphatase synthesis response regulator PhoP
MNKKKILLVDDEPDILEFLSYNFRKKEFNVSIANNALEGLKVASTEIPDIIISDILMPGMDGIDMCKLLRGKKEFDQTHIVFLTAVHDDYRFMHAMYSGGDQYLAKPIRFDYLFTIVNKLMEYERI